MPDKRVTVWVQHFKDRPTLMLQWIDPDAGRRKSRSANTHDEKEAEKARADLEYELNHGRYQEASRMTWERFRELFETEYVAPLRPDTRRNYEATLDLFQELCKPARLKSISERTISAFVTGMRNRPGRGYGCQNMMASTIKVRLQFLHTALEWAVSQKMLVELPKFPAVKVPKKKPQPVPIESFERLYGKAEGDPQMQSYLLCGWLAGLRLNEALALEWEETDKAPWVDFNKQRIWLPAGFVKAVADQWVPLDPALYLALQALPRNGRNVFLFRDSRGEPLTANGVSQKVTALARKAGVRMTMKTLRRGFGCRYAGKVPAQVLQKLMRHANIKTTMDFYANVDAAVEEAVLGPQRNSLRNTSENQAIATGPVQDASPSADTTNSPSAG